MSQHIPEAEGHEKLVANKFGVSTQDISVVTRTRQLNKIYIATLSKSITIESKNKPKEHVATEDCRPRQRPATKTENSIATELYMSRKRDQFGL